MAKLGDLILRVGADTSKLNQGLGDARKAIAKNTREIQNLGRNLTVGITAPLAIMGATSVQAFREQNKAIAQVEAGLKSTAGQVGFTSQELQKMASDLQNKTLFGDEVILKDATAQLLTFTNISGQNFARTQQAALDLATRLDGDLKGASIQLGKALNDPVANLSALSRSGIQFSEDQKAVIKSLAETGQLAEAQTIILDELNKQYGGSAEAAAEADGGFTQLANSFGDLQEEIGKLLVQYLRPIVDRLKTFVQFLQNTSDGTKTLALGIAGVAAAIGPVLIILPNLVSGIKMARAAFALLNTTMLANPFGAVAAAIGLVVGAVIMLNNASSEGSDKVDDLKKSLAGMDLEQQAASIEGAVTAQRAYVEQLKEQKAALEALPKYKRSSGSQAARDLKKLAETLETANAELAAMQQLEEGVALKLKQKADEANNASVSVTNLGNSTEETTEKLKDKSKTLGFLMNKLEEVPDTDIWKPVRDSTDKTNQSLGFLFNMLAEVPSVLSPGQIAAQELADEMAAKFTELAGKVEQVGGTIGNAFANVVNQGIEIKRALEEGLITPLEAMEQKAENAKKAVRGLVKDAILALINMAKMNVIANATSPANAANLASGGLAAPAFIVAGLSMLEGFVGGLTAFADGGIVSGPTMGLVGEYPGASTNPEVIAPLDKLRGMLGGQAVQVTGKISGRDILLTSERNAIDRNRVRGF